MTKNNNNKTLALAYYVCLVSLGQTIQEALEVEPQTPQHLPRQAQALYCLLLNTLTIN